MAVLRASRMGLLSTRYEIARDGTTLCTWKPSAFFGGGSFVLEGRRYDVARGGWSWRRYRLLDESGELLAMADAVGRAEWTLETGGHTYSFERQSLIRSEHVLIQDDAVAGSVRRVSTWRGEAEADLPGLPLSVQVFVLVSLLAVWDEE
ncbi:hypothetical protein ACQPZQ_08440 [Pseudonocardia sp. CA-142604]|uniref:hypothetical protein n=1 Tax=Pseudonocardia sp. CA-142604 TaxID=3240024 RepID=UPI003D8E480E